MLCVAAVSALVLHAAVLLLPVPASATALQPVIDTGAVLEIDAAGRGCCRSTVAVNVTLVAGVDGFSELASVVVDCGPERGGAPGFDFGDAGVAGKRGGDVDADTVGRVGGEIHRALDQVVAADAAQRHPGRAVPALHGKRGDAVQRERHRVGRLDRVGVVVLDRIDDDVIDRLAAVEVDLHPVGPGVLVRRSSRR